MVQFKKFLFFTQRMEKGTLENEPLEDEAASVTSILSALPKDVETIENHYPQLPNEQKNLLEAFSAGVKWYGEHFTQNTTANVSKSQAFNNGDIKDDPFYVADSKFAVKGKKAQGVSIDAYYCDMEITRIKEHIAGRAQNQGWQAFFGMGTTFVDTPEGYGCLFQKGSNTVIVTIEKERKEKGHVVTLIRSRIQ